MRRLPFTTKRLRRAVKQRFDLTPDTCPSLLASFGERRAEVEDLLVDSGKHGLTYGREVSNWIVHWRYCRLEGHVHRHPLC